MPRHLDTSTDVGTSTHFDDFFRVVAEEYFCGSRGFDREFDKIDTLFEAWADISSQNTLPSRAEQFFSLKGPNILSYRDKCLHSAISMFYLIAINA